MHTQINREDLVLASNSPRRSELLSAAGIRFSVVSPSCDETPLPGEAPRDLVERLSLEKARSVATHSPAVWIIGADTIVVIDGEVLGKPRDEADAMTMLARLQGRTHSVVSGFALIRGEPSVMHVESHLSTVTMRTLTPAMIRRYIETGEPMDKAGAYAIQGVGAALIERVEGSYTNVVGLNLSSVIMALEKFAVIE